MPNPQPERIVLSSFTSEQWSGRPAQDGGTLFVGCAVIGAVLWLVLMIFVPGLRSGGAFTLLSVPSPSARTIKGKASAERKFLEDLTSTVNDIIEGADRKYGPPVVCPTVQGTDRKRRPPPAARQRVSGLELQAVREQPAVQLPSHAVKRADNVVRTTRVVITVTPPDYGITSFDRLPAAAAESGGDRGTAVP